jgi:flagellar basal body-associated protein FliL
MKHQISYIIIVAIIVAIVIAAIVCYTHPAMCGAKAEEFRWGPRYRWPRTRQLWDWEHPFQIGYPGLWY